MRWESGLRIAVMGRVASAAISGAPRQRWRRRPLHCARIASCGHARAWPGGRGGPEEICLSQVSVTDDPATIGPVDLVMLCVKLWDTEAAARQLLPIVTPHTGIVSFPERRDQG